jgi:hypothetical protein
VFDAFFGDFHKLLLCRSWCCEQAFVSRLHQLLYFRLSPVRLLVYLQAAQDLYTRRNKGRLKFLEDQRRRKRYFDSSTNSELSTPTTVLLFWEHLQGRKFKGLSFSCLKFYIGIVFSAHVSRIGMCEGRGHWALCNEY